MIRGPFESVCWESCNKFWPWCVLSVSSHTVWLASVLHLLPFPRSLERKTFEESWRTLRCRPLPCSVRRPFLEQLQVWPSWSSSSDLQAYSQMLSSSWIWGAVKHPPVCGLLRERVSGIQSHSWEAESALHSCRVKLLLTWPSFTCKHFLSSSFLIMSPLTSTRERRVTAAYYKLHYRLGKITLQI